MTVVTGHGGKEVVNLDGKLKTVRELVDYWNPQRIQQTIDKLSMGKNKETMEKYSIIEQDLIYAEKMAGLRT